MPPLFTSRRNWQGLPAMEKNGTTPFTQKTQETTGKKRQWLG
jgi:hypothetical protein